MQLGSLDSSRCPLPWGLAHRYGFGRTPPEAVVAFLALDAGVHTPFDIVLTDPAWGVGEVRDLVQARLVHLFQGCVGGATRAGLARGIGVRLGLWRGRLRPVPPGRVLSGPCRGPQGSVKRLEKLSRDGCVVLLVGLIRRSSVCSRCCFSSSVSMSRGCRKDVDLRRIKDEKRRCLRCWCVLRRVPDCSPVQRRRDTGAVVVG